MESANKGFLKRKDLLSIAIGQIIGSGIMTMSVIALGMTGRSLFLVFLICGVMSLLAQIPTAYLGGTMRISGGTYSQAVLFLGDKFSGFYIPIFILANLTKATLAIGFANYLSYLFPALTNHKIAIASVVMIVVFVINYFGTGRMAKAQTVMFYLMMVGLAAFIAFGLPQVQWKAFFGDELFSEPFLLHGSAGFIEAIAYLIFASNGAQVLLNFSDECKNPEKDIPIMMVVSTVIVCIIYALVGIVVGGVLPTAQVAPYESLAPVADAIMPRPVMFCFVLFGACMALGTTLNSSLAQLFNPLRKAAEDGWLPKIFAKTNKYNIPTAVLIFLFCVNMIPILFGVSLSALSQWVVALNNLMRLLLCVGIFRLPKLYGNLWKKSSFHVPDVVFYVTMILATLINAFQVYANTVNLEPAIALANVIVLVASVLYTIWRIKGGFVHIDHSISVTAMAQKKGEEEGR